MLEELSRPIDIIFINLQERSPKISHSDARENLFSCNHEKLFVARSNNWNFLVLQFTDRKNGWEDKDRERRASALKSIYLEVLVSSLVYDCFAATSHDFNSKHNLDRYQQTIHATNHLITKHDTADALS